jgi:hypothetical protein
MNTGSLFLVISHLARVISYLGRLVVPDRLIYIIRSREVRFGFGGLVATIVSDELRKRTVRHIVQLVV